MATRPDTLPENVGRITAPDANYPYGSAKNDSTGTTGDGTPFAAPLLNDWYGFSQALLVNAGVVPSGAAETALNSQLFDCIEALIAAAATDGDEVATLKTFARATAPTGWLKANGAAVSRATYSALFAELVTAAGFTSQTFTVTLATPGVFTKAAHGFLGGERLRLSTTGSLPTGLNTTADYFVERIDANTFYLTSGIPFGTRVNTSGAQSGTHSYLQSWWGLGDGSTTFNLPDMRGEALRGWDDGRGIDTNRAFGSAQKGSAHSFDIGAATALIGDKVSTITDAAAARIDLGLDTGTLTDYSANVGYYGAATAVGGALTNSTDLAWGVTRMRNVAVLVCIKY